MDMHGVAGLGELLLSFVAVTEVLDLKEDLPQVFGFFGTKLPAQGLSLHCAAANTFDGSGAPRQDRNHALALLHEVVWRQSQKSPTLGAVTAQATIAKILKA